ncbi:ZP domain-containing protein [Trichonephila clavipes]|nr:ZP domain-containing protein [Trichonephila clavipes]
MHCEATSMTAIVKVITPFRGRLYALGHPYECYAVSVRANGEVALTMPLHGRTCGTKNLGNGTFVNSVVVQHHPFVLRSTDRRIDVACDYEEVQRKLRGGKQVLEGYAVLILLP